MTDLRKRTILLTLAGSHAHGTARSESDIDICGVAVPTRGQAYGLFQSFEQENEPARLAPYFHDLSPEEHVVASRSKLEGTVFALSKFLLLASEANPNILEILFSREEEIRRLHPLGELLRANRDLFVTERCRHTFGGYAASQLARIRLHYRWHHDGPERPPTRTDFGLPEQSLIPRHQMEAAEAAVRTRLDRWQLDLAEIDACTRIGIENRLAATLVEWNLASDERRWTAAARWIGLDDNLIEIMRQERRWRAARDEWQRYRQWLKNRNPHRARLEVKYGYDTKHGAHLVRLLRMGLEVVSTGRVHVWRGDRDAEELAYIREGGWSYERLCEWTEDARKKLEEARSIVPPKPDRQAIESLCLELTEGGFELEAIP
jgi:predicted nucleotidyltransferase